MAMQKGGFGLSRPTPTDRSWTFCMTLSSRPISSGSCEAGWREADIAGPIPKSTKSFRFDSKQATLLLKLFGCSR